VESHAAARLEHGAGVHNGSYRQPRAPPDPRSLEDDHTGREIAALPDLAAGERRLRSDDALIPDSHWKRWPAVPADRANDGVREEAHALSEHHGAPLLAITAP
jgi:hypothetical protein